MTQSQVQKWECFIVDKGKASGVPQLEAIGMEKLVCNKFICLYVGIIRKIF